MSKADKRSIYIIAAAIIFMIGWWYLGEWDVVQFMSENVRTVVSVILLAGLFVLGYFMHFKR